MYQVDNVASLRSRKSALEKAGVEQLRASPMFASKRGQINVKRLNQHPHSAALLSGAAAHPINA
ncbi:hypothetical protein ACVDG8_027170 [Mesorhizobium sp. ORM8.1]